MKYDVMIIGAGPGGIFSAYELLEKNPKLKVLYWLQELFHYERIRRCRCFF